MISNSTPAADPLQSGDLLSEAEAAKILGLSRITLRNWRSQGGKGPSYIRLGSKTIRYRRADLAEFAKLHVVQQPAATSKSTAPPKLPSAARVPFPDLE